MSNAAPTEANLPAADDWDAHWDEFSDAAERNPAQAYRRRLALRLLERDGAPVRLLDIGSGQGDFIAQAAARWSGAELAGVEISAQGIRISQEKVARARFFAADLTTGAAPPAEMAGWGTHAVCSEVLEHVDDPTALMRTARSWLAPGARVVVTVPGGPMSAFDKHIGHRRHFTGGLLASILTQAGYEVDWCNGAGFPFFNVYRGVVIARGDKLVSDVEANDQGEPASLLARAVMGAFHPLMFLNLPRTRFGWQTVGVARVPQGA